MKIKPSDLYSPTPELQAAAKAVHDAISAATRCAEAISKKIAEHAELKRGHDDAQAAAASAEVQFAVSAADENADELEEAAKQAVEKSEVCRRALERSDLVIAALKAKQADSDAVVLETKEALNLELGIFAGHVQAEMLADVMEAAAPLVAAVRRIEAYRMATLNLSAAFFSSQIVIPNPASPNRDLVGNGRTTVGEDYGLLNDFSREKTAIAIRDRLAFLVDARNALTVHAKSREFAIPPAKSQG